MIGPDELTGEMVKAIRTKHKITREAFKDRCVAGGLNWGKSVARLCNIEAKDSWKSGDREVVAQIINALEGDDDGTRTTHSPSGWPATKTPDESNVDNPDVTSGQSNVDSRGHETRSAPQAETPSTRDPGDPFAASKKFLDGVRAEYAPRHAAADAMPPVPVWCDDGESDADDETGVTVESMITAHNVTVQAYDEGGVLPTGEPLLLNGSAIVTFDYVPSEELDEDDVSLINLLGDNSNPNVFSVSNSLVQTAKRCKRKWWLAWYRGLAPKHENLLDVRSTGTRVHRALQAWYVPEGETPTDPRDALERVLVEDWTAIKMAAEERGHDEFVIDNLAEKFNKAASLERAMVEGYVEWLQESGADSQLKIIGAEQSIRVHLYDHVRADGEITPVHAIGLLDVQAYRTSDGAKLFVDHKTVGSIKDPVAMLPMNEQMLHYHLLQWLSTSDSEERCDGALYNMLRRVKRTAAAKPPFYDRYEVRHNTEELETYRRRLIAETRDILHMVERLEAGADPMDVAYPTPSKNCTWDCDFFSVCAMFDDGSRVEDAIDSLYTTVDPNARYEPIKGTE